VYPSVNLTHSLNFTGESSQRTTQSLHSEGNIDGDREPGVTLVTGTHCYLYPGTPFLDCGRRSSAGQPPQGTIMYPTCYNR
jgi:hypothetical protein